MKQSENMIQYDQNDAFRKRLDNWQGVIGLASWNYSSPTFDQLRNSESQGRALQAKAIRISLSIWTKWVWQSLVIVISNIGSNIEKRHQHNKTSKQLLALDRQQLNDIGLTQEDVYAYVHNRKTAEELNDRRANLSATMQNRINQQNPTLKQNTRSRINYLNSSKNDDLDYPVEQCGAG